MVAFVGKLIAAKGVELLLDAWSLVLERRPNALLVVIGFGSDAERFQAQAAPLGERVIFTGRLEHDELYHVLALCEALVVPSIFPEAFGMVAAEAAACGVLPISAAHSGLAEVSDTLGEHVPPAGRLVALVSDRRRHAAQRSPSESWAGCRPTRQLQAQTREALVSTVRERWSWQGVAQERDRRCARGARRPTLWIEFRR